MKKLLLFTVMLLAIAACKKDDTEDDNFDTAEQAKIDDKLIHDFIKTQPDSIKNNIISDPSGIYYVILKEGNGEHPNSNSSVTVDYIGSLMETEEVFDDGTLFEMPLFKLIEGWQIGVPKLSKLGKGLFFIPSGLAYGPDGAGSAIPPNAVLIFEIYLRDFQ